MNDLFDELSSNPWGRLLLEYLVTGGIRNQAVLLLVMARLTGLFVVAPWMLPLGVPLAARIGLTFVMSFFLSPIVATSAAADQPIRTVLMAIQSLSDGPLPLPDLVRLFAGEIGTGTVLGLSGIMVFHGLKLAGEWLNRHSGIGFGLTLNPDWLDGESAIGRLTVLLGIATFLVMEPFQGQSLVLRSILESFDTLPLGAATESVSPMEIVLVMVQQSMMLGIRVAIPFVVIMLLIDLTLAFARRGESVPLNAPGFLFRMGLGMLVLTYTMTSLPDVITDVTLTVFR